MHCIHCLNCTFCTFLCAKLCATYYHHFYHRESQKTPHPKLPRCPQVTTCREIKLSSRRLFSLLDQLGPSCSSIVFARSYQSGDIRRLKNKNDDKTSTWSSQMHKAQKWSIGLGISLARKRRCWKSFTSHRRNRHCRALPYRRLSASSRQRTEGEHQ